MDIKDIKTREEDFSSLWERMESDRDMVQKSTFRAREFGDKNAAIIPKTYHVDLRLPGKDYSKFMSKLLGLVMKYTVLTEDAKFDNGNLINWINDADFVVNKRMRKAGKDSYRARHTAFACLAGWFVEQNNWRLDDKGLLIPDTRTIWPRYISWDTDVDGLTWACPLYYRTPKDVLSEYPDAAVNENDSKLIEVRDSWDREENVVYINDVAQEGVPNLHGYVPFVIIPAPWGPIFDGDEALASQGESIFFPQRSLYDEANFNASISKTMAREGMDPPIQSAGNVPEDKPGAGDMIGNQTEPLQPIPRADMTNAQRNYSGLISGTLQQNSFSMTSSGSVTSPMSGDAIDSLNRGGEEVLNSRKTLLQDGFAMSAQMRLDQYIALGEPLKMGKQGHTYKPEDLVGEFDIECRMFDGSPQGYAQRGQAAGMLFGTMPKRWIRQEIIMADDPDNVDDEVDSEKGEDVDPIDGMYDRVLGNIKRGFSRKDDSLKMLALMELQTLKLVLKQRVGQGVPDPMNNKTEKERPMPATMKGGNNVQ